MSSYLVISASTEPGEDYTMTTYPSCNPLYTEFRQHGARSEGKELTYKRLCEIRDSISSKLIAKNKLYEVCKGAVLDDLPLVEDLISDIEMLEVSLHELQFLFTMLDHIETGSCDFNSIKYYID